MEVKESFESLQKEKRFIDWKKDNEDAYLSYAMADSSCDEWQFGFYNEKKDKITTFFREKNKIKDICEDEVFKEIGAKISLLELEKIKITESEAKKTAKEFHLLEYPKELATKEIIIMQNLDEYGVIWNISFIMHSFNALNIKISAESGKILAHSMSKLFEWKK